MSTVLQSKRANFVVFKIFCYIQESIQEGSTLSLWEDTTKHLYNFVGSHMLSRDLGVPLWLHFVN